MNEIVSVIIPIYNEKRYFKTCINSVINQTYKRLQIVVIDDGSEEECVKNIDSVCGQDNRIEIYHIQNGGVSNARNIGLTKAKGKWVLFVDADDLLLPGAIESLISIYYETNCSVFGNYIRDTEKFDVQKKHSYGTYTNNEIISTIYDFNKHINQFEHIDNSKTSFFYSVWGKLYVRDVILQNMISFESQLALGEDIVFNLEYLKQVPKVVVSDTSVYCYRNNDSSASHIFLLKDLNSVINLVESISQNNQLVATNFCVYFLLLTLIDVVENRQNEVKHAYFDFIKTERVSSWIKSYDSACFLPGVQGNVFRIVLRLWKSKLYGASYMLIRLYLELKITVKHH